ncbi:MAG: arsenosugar biosynthesis radical SAM (seleno)protein ArsS [Desulfobacterales bacterium]
MSRGILEHCVHAAGYAGVTTIDITGGAPELHPDIEWLVHAMAGLGKRLIVRSNLVVLLEPANRSLMEFFAAHKVELVGSLPEYRAERADRQRGAGTFNQATAAIRELNRIGYGRSGGILKLGLVHNPAGAYLPGSRTSWEAEYRRRLQHEFGVNFNTLFTLVNCPIGRYLEYLTASGNLKDYLRTLQSALNAQTGEKVMCRRTPSVGWGGHLYDCDFNQVLDLMVNSGAPIHIKDCDIRRLAHREIVVREHCFACTAGTGSSCQGSLTK